MNYQYCISAWIYKTLRNANPDYAAFLHRQGYGSNHGKRYKLFCFSRFAFGRPKLLKDRQLFKITKDEIILIISFDVPEAANYFIEGISQLNTTYIGNNAWGLELMVKSIENLPEPDFKTLMKYRLRTPWVISYKSKGSKHPRYLLPSDRLFNSLSLKHLTDKYHLTRHRRLKDESIDFIPDNNFTRAGFLIKEGSNSETRIIGNLFDFKLYAPLDLHKMIWNSGVSEKSSLGFGWCEVSE